MQTAKRLADKEDFRRHCRKIDYEEFADALRSGQYMFLEGPVKRQTTWKAARKLSGMIGRKVVAVSGEEQQFKKKPVAGYLFMVDESKEPRQDELVKRTLNY